MAKNTFVESDYGVSASAWKMLDYANPAWRPVGHSERGKNLQASYKMLLDKEGNVIEPVEVYWARVRREITEKYRAIDAAQREGII